MTSGCLTRVIHVVDLICCTHVVRVMHIMKTSRGIDVTHVNMSPASCKLHMSYVLFTIYMIYMCTCFADDIWRKQPAICNAYLTFVCAIETKHDTTKETHRRSNYKSKTRQRTPNTQARETKHSNSTLNKMRRDLFVRSSVESLVRRLAPFELAHGRAAHEFWKAAPSGDVWPRWLHPANTPKEGSAKIRRATGRSRMSVCCV